jgi:glycosyltransferase involved in cell wall biosynthesis
MPRLTIGLPMRNSSRHLRQALDSVLAQTFTDWTLLAIDDASTDTTAQIVADYAHIDNRIKLVTFGSQGVSQAENWNRVICLAETQYVSMFGHDDIMMPDMLMREIAMMDAHPDMAMVFAQGPLIGDDGAHLPGKHGRPIMQPDWSDDHVLSPGTLGPQLICEGFVHPSSVMLRTKIAQGIPLFPENMPLYLDIDYWSRVGDCGSVGYAAGDLLRYRVPADSAYARAMRSGANLRDTHTLFERMMAHWQWDISRQAAFKEKYYLAHAARALRAAELAWERHDTPTWRLQMAICLSLAHTAQGASFLGASHWIARWLNIWLFKKRMSSPKRIGLLILLCSLPPIKGWLHRYFSAPLANTHL